MFFTAFETAFIMGKIEGKQILRKHVYYLISEYRLTPVKVGRVVRISSFELERYYGGTEGIRGRIESIAGDIDGKGDGGVFTGGQQHHLQKDSVRRTQGIHAGRRRLQHSKERPDGILPKKFLDMRQLEFDFAA